MKLKHLSLAALLGFVLFFGACEEGETETIIIDHGYDYFPLEVGRSWTYRVDSIIYDPAVFGTAVDTVSSWVQDRIVDTLADNTGLPLFRVERYARSSENLPWEIRQVLALSREESRAFRMEDNLRFIVLVFPAMAGKSWNSIAFFDPAAEVLVAGERIEMFKGWESRIVAAGVPLSSDSLHWEDGLIVQHAERENLIERRYVQEHYVRGVGLVYREAEIFDTQCQECCAGDLDACEQLPWPEKAEKGFSLRQYLISYQ